MKKIGIVTITNSGYNFGNRLQNYALQEKMRQLGCEVETIKSANGVGNSLIISKVRYLIKRIVKNSDLRVSKFAAYDRRYVTYSRKIRYGTINEKSFDSEFDYFITGSDQVWNPNFHFNSDFEFLTFAENEKRFSYAASIGIDEIPEEKRKHYVENLMGMKGISIREDISVDMVKRITSREDVYLHIDPTMLIHVQAYEDMEGKPEIQLPEKYMLVYILGAKSEKQKEYIRNLSQKMQVQVVEMSESKGTEFYGMGPENFLYLIHHAEYICTDSFHGTVFCILFHKLFTIFEREGREVSMNSRIESLARLFHMENRIYGALSVEESTSPISYGEIEEILTKERERSEKYLRQIVE